MKHTLVTRETCGCDPDSYTSCPICDGGLALCSVCGGAEGWMTTDCPGEHVPYEKGEAVGRREIDFVDGQWITLSDPVA